MNHCFTLLCVYVIFNCCVYYSNRNVDSFYAWHCKAVGMEVQKTNVKHETDVKGKDRCELKIS